MKVKTKNALEIKRKINNASSQISGMLDELLKTGRVSNAVYDTANPEIKKQLGDILDPNVLLLTNNYLPMLNYLSDKIIPDWNGTSYTFLKYNTITQSAVSIFKNSWCTCPVKLDFTKSERVAGLLKYYGIAIDICEDIDRLRMLVGRDTTSQNGVLLTEAERLADLLIKKLAFQLDYSLLMGNIDPITMNNLVVVDPLSVNGLVYQIQAEGATNIIDFAGADLSVDVLSEYLYSRLATGFPVTGIMMNSGTLKFLQDKVRCTSGCGGCATSVSTLIAPSNQMLNPFARTLEIGGMMVNIFINNNLPSTPVAGGYTTSMLMITDSIAQSPSPLINLATLGSGVTNVNSFKNECGLETVSIRGASDLIMRAPELSKIFKNFKICTSETASDNGFFTTPSFLYSGF